MTNLNNYQAIVRRIQHFTVSVESPSDFPADAVDAALENWGMLSTYIEDMEPEHQEISVASVSAPMLNEDLIENRRSNPFFGSLVVSKDVTPHGLDHYSIREVATK